MPDVQTFRDRMPIIAKMIDKALNGDAADGDTKVAFTLVCCKPLDVEDIDDDDGAEGVTSMVTNCAHLRDVLSMLLTVIADAPKPPFHTGHA